MSNWQETRGAQGRNNVVFVNVVFSGSAFGNWMKKALWRLWLWFCFA
jgi:hypothetical protein